MAISTGMMCFRCEKKPAKPNSHFCGKRCLKAHMAEADGPVQCDAGENRYGSCSAEMDTVHEAVNAGWTNLQPDPEGATNNYTGTCPECQS